jgi:hypothetical protein
MHDNAYDKPDVIGPIEDAVAQAIYAYRSYGDFRQTPNPDYYRQQALAIIRHLFDAGWKIEHIPYDAWLAAQGIDPVSGESS